MPNNIVDIIIERIIYLLNILNNYSNLIVAVATVFYVITSVVIPFFYRKVEIWSHAKRWISKLRELDSINQYYLFKFGMPIGLSYVIAAEVSALLPFIILYSLATSQQNLLLNNIYVIFILIYFPIIAAFIFLLYIKLRYFEAQKQYSMYIICKLYLFYLLIWLFAFTISIWIVFLFEIKTILGNITMIAVSFISLIT